MHRKLVYLFPLVFVCFILSSCDYSRSKYDYGEILETSWQRVNENYFDPEFNGRDWHAIDVGKGSSFSSSNMEYDVISGSILNNILEYQLPVFFFVGTSDCTTPHQLITDYYQMIKAPKKEIIYFKQSAHFPFYEEPDYFCKAVIETWLDVKQQHTK